jgi:hypothetical protein
LTRHRPWLDTRTILAASPETPDPSAKTPPDLQVQASYGRDPVVLLKSAGWAVLGLLGAAALFWARPSLTEEYIRGGGRTGATHGPSFLGILLYVSAFALALLGVVLILVLIWGAIRGVVMAVCPACSTKVLVGADRRVECTGCGRMLDALPPTRE